MIEQLILFHSTYSDACKQTINFITSTRIPVKIVDCDTKEARENLKKSGVTHVPTLLIVHDGGKQTFQTGKIRIQEICERILSESQPKPKKQKSKDKHKKSLHSKKGLYDADSSEEELELDDDNEVQEDIFIDNDEQPKKNSTKGLMVGPSAGARSNMDALLKEAEKMKKERQKQLNYDPNKEARS